MQVDITQNTEDWKNFRSSRIGASDAAPIMGLSKWKTAHQLWQQKLGLDGEQKQTFAMKRGHDLEDLARKSFTDYTGFEVTPKVFVHPEYNFLMASLDGITDDLQVAVEIKCNGKENHDLALQGKVPDYYMAQMQHQMYVCELNWMYYFSFDGKDGVSFIVGREELFIEEMLKKELEFYRCMTEFAPPPMTDRDYRKRSDHSWKVASERYLSVKARLKELEKEEEEAKRVLLSLSGGQNTIGAGLKISQSMRKCGVDYSRIPELIGVDLDEYRGEPTMSWRITETKEDHE